jgi:hypothetical protein
VLSVQEETWVGDRLQFRIVALMLAQLADKIQRTAQTQGKLMLGKK